jgi:hypothetical protein
VNRDLAFGTAGAAIACGYYWLAGRIRASVLADAVGPQGLPIAYAAVLLLLSLILMARSLRRASLAQGRRSTDPEPRTLHAGRVAGMLAIGSVYVLLVPWLGYTITLAGLLLAVTWYVGGVVTRAVVLVAVSGAVVFWLLFVRLLGIPHPAGAWAAFF